MAFQCNYCHKDFARETSMAVHMCEPKRRRLNKDDRGAQLGFQAYIRFYEQTQGSARLKTFDDFCDSQKPLDHNNLYRVDNFKGFTAGGFATLANSNTTQTTTTGGNTNYNGYGLGADYIWNKLYVTAAYQTLKSEQTFTTSEPTYWTTNASSSAPGGGVNTQDTQKYVGATYDFGVVKAFAQYVARKATSTLNSSNYLSRTAQQIGVRGNFTPNIEGWASVGNGRYDAFGPASPTVNFNAFQVGSNYWLSKRTNLYAIYGQNKTSSTNVANLAPALAASNYAVGVRHTF